MLLASRIPYQLEDGQYWTVSKSQWRAMVAGAGLRKMRWLQDLFDCDDYARLLRVAVLLRWRVNGIGTITNGQHVWNIVVAVDGVMHIEPQTGEEILELTGIYDLTDATISF